MSEEEACETQHRKNSLLLRIASQFAWQALIRRAVPQDIDVAKLHALQSPLRMKLTGPI